MIIIVTKFFMRNSNCPKYIMPIGVELGKTPNHAFESEEEFDRFLDGLEKWVKELNGDGKVPLSLNHVKDDNAGEVTVFRRNIGYGDIMRINYIRLRGHVVVGLDGRTLHQHPFIKDIEE